MGLCGLSLKPEFIGLPHRKKKKKKKKELRAHMAFVMRSVEPMAIWYELNSKNQ